MNPLTQVHQPDRVNNDQPPVWPLVIKDIEHCYKGKHNIVKDMQDRDAFGRMKHGGPLQPFNGRSALIDGYQENLDLDAYLKQRDIESGKGTSVAYALALDLTIRLKDELEGGEVALSGDTVGYSVSNSIFQTFNLAVALKPNDRSEKDRRYAILITELEKLLAYADFYLTK